MNPLLEIQGLEAFYGNSRVLEIGRLSLEQGEVVVVLGTNGAGKTTLLRSISGLVSRRGRITLDGARIDERGVAAIACRGVAHVPQGRGTFASLSVLENLRVATLRGGGWRRAGSAFARIFDYFPVLRERRSQIAGTLSGGEQQMLAVARALLPEPRLLLLDEPTMGLGPAVVEVLYAALRRVISEHATTVVWVEQQAIRARDLAHRVVLLERGRMVMSGDPAMFSDDRLLKRTYLGG